MNILLINHYAGSNRHGMEYRPYYLAREWVRQGHNVTIAAASYSHLRTENPATEGLIETECIEGITYLWLPTPAYCGNGLHRAFNIFAFLRALTKNKERLIRESMPDAVIASSTYPLDMVVARGIGDRTGARVVYEVHDLWPLTLIELGGMKRWHPFILLMQWAENYAYRHADAVVSMLKCAGLHMQQHGMALDKFVYIPNGVALDEWDVKQAPIPELHGAILDRLRVEKQFIVGFAGSYGLAMALDPLLEAASLIRDVPISFVLVGQGPRQKALEAKTQQLGLTNVHILTSVARGSIPALLGRMDALYCGWNRRSIYRFGISPNKLMDYMMAGKPILHAVAAGNDPVADARCGLSFAPEDPAALADSAKALAAMDNSEREAMGMRGREFVLANNDYYVLAEKFVHVMQCGRHPSVS